TDFLLRCRLELIPFLQSVEPLLIRAQHRKRFFIRPFRINQGDDDIGLLPLITIHLDHTFVFSALRKSRLRAEKQTTDRDDKLDMYSHSNKFIVAIYFKKSIATLFPFKKSFCSARSKAVSSNSVIKSFFAPKASSSFKILSSFEINAALCNAVVPSLSCALISAPSSAAFLTRFTFSFATAKWKSELPSPCGAVTSSPLLFKTFNLSEQSSVCG